MSDDKARTAPPSQPDAATPPRPLPWFTADEIPLPPPEMRKPPQKDGEPSLFDDEK